jgi:hypothetical protein
MIFNNTFTKEALSLKKHNQDLYDIALAHALWESLAYKNEGC